MKITICGSMKFYEQMLRLQKELEKSGHTVLMPIKVKGLDYWAKDGSKRVEAKKKLKLINGHMDKVGQSGAILVVNITKGRIKNYIGANTFLEIGYAYYLGIKIFLLNPIPKMSFIQDEILAMEPIILNGDLNKVR